MRAFQASIINPRKHAALDAVRTGRMTVPEAARFAGVSVRSMVGWCRHERIDVPAEHVPPPVRARRERSL